MMSDTEVGHEAIRLLVSARLIRRVMETVISNLWRMVTSGHALKPDVLDMQKECDPEKLLMSQFKDEDFDLARKMLLERSPEHGPRSDPGRAVDPKRM